VVTHKYKHIMKHMLLHDVIWLTFGDGSTIVPLVGSPMQMYECFHTNPGVFQHHPPAAR